MKEHLNIMHLRFAYHASMSDAMRYAILAEKYPHYYWLNNALRVATKNALDYGNRYYARINQLRGMGKNFITEKEAVSLVACLESVGKNVFQIGKKGLVSILYEYAGYNFRVEKNWDTGELEIAVWAKDTYVKDIQFSSFK